MTARFRILFILTITLISLLGLIYLASRATLLDNYLQLEQTDVQNNLARAMNGLDLQLKAFLTLNEDWAHWDDTDQFIQDGNDNYLVI